MRVLGIETSCDETGVALYDTREGLLSHRLHSQVDLHTVYGGVVPELASRDHVRRLVPLVDETLDAAGLTRRDLDAIAFHPRPGPGRSELGVEVAPQQSAVIDHRPFCRGGAVVDSDE